MIIGIHSIIPKAPTIPDIYLNIRIYLNERTKIKVNPYINIMGAIS